MSSRLQVGPKELASLESRLRTVNKMADIKRSQRAKVRLYLNDA